MQSNEILSEPTCDLIWDRCHREIIKGETKHLIVLSSVPIAYPRMVCECIRRYRLLLINPGYAQEHTEQPKITRKGWSVWRSRQQARRQC